MRFQIGRDKLNRNGNGEECGKIEMSNVADWFQGKFVWNVFAAPKISNQLHYRM